MVKVAPTGKRDVKQQDSLALTIRCLNAHNREPGGATSEQQQLCGSGPGTSG